MFSHQKMGARMFYTLFCAAAMILVVMPFGFVPDVAEQPRLAASRRPLAR